MSTLDFTTLDFTWRPLEPLYFGPPASTTAGESHGAHSLFPPPPMTVQGIVRTRLLVAASGLEHSLDDWSEKAKGERERLIGKPNEMPENWRLAGPFPARLAPKVEPWFPVPRFALRRATQSEPADIEIGGEEHVRRASAPPPVIAHRIESKHPVEHDMHSDAGVEPWDVGAPEQDVDEPVSGWISARNLRWLLAGDNEWDPRGFDRHLPPFVTREVRTGLAIDSRSGSAKDGMLYSLGELRMARGSGFLGALWSNLPAEHAAALTQGTGSAGRGGRPVQFGAARELDADWTYVRAGRHLLESVEDGDPFWLVSLSPARVENVWRPLTEPSPHVVIRAALVGPSVVLGGLSMVGWDSRPNRSYVPAGSAWLVQIVGRDAASRREALDALHDRPSIGQRSDHGFGFGHTLVGLARRQ